VVYDLKDLDGYKGVTTQALFGLEVSMLLKLLILLCHTLI
jgi:hypothetical protein